MQPRWLMLMGVWGEPGSALSGCWRFRPCSVLVPASAVAMIVLGMIALGMNEPKARHF